METARYRRHGDPVRPGPRLKIEIESMAAGCYVPGCYVPMERGTNVCEINAEDLASVEADVETRLDLWTKAHEVNERHFWEWLRGLYGTVEPGPDATQSEHVRWGDIVQRGRAKYQGAPELEFMNLIEVETGTRRERRPYRSVKVLEKLAPAMSDDARIAQDVLRNVIPMFQASTGAGPLRVQDADAENAALRAELAELRAGMAALVERLEARENAPKRGGWPKGKPRKPAAQEAPSAPEGEPVE